MTLTKKAIGCYQKAAAPASQFPGVSDASRGVRGSGILGAEGSIVLDPLHGEDLEIRPAAPSVLGETSLRADLTQKRFAVPAELGGDLREEKPVPVVFADMEAMDAYPDVGWVRGGTKRGQHGNLDPDLREFAGSDGGETGVSRGGRRRAVRDGFGERANGVHKADAPPQRAGAGERHEDGTRGAQGGVGRRRTGVGTAGYAFADRPSRD